MSVVKRDTKVHVTSNPAVPGLRLTHLVVPTHNPQNLTDTGKRVILVRTTLN